MKKIRNAILLSACLLCLGLDNGENDSDVSAVSKYCLDLIATLAPTTDITEHETFHMPFCISLPPDKSDFAKGDVSGTTFLIKILEEEGKFSAHWDYHIAKALKARLGDRFPTISLPSIDPEIQVGPGNKELEGLRLIGTAIDDTGEKWILRLVTILKATTLESGQIIVYNPPY